MLTLAGWLELDQKICNRHETGFGAHLPKKEVGFKNCRHLDGVAVDDRPVLLEVLRGEAALVNDFHLLHNCALP